MKTILTRITKFQHFYPYTVALVGSSFKDQLNFMTCAWHTALSFEPPLFGIAIARKRYTHELISQAREFTVNFISMKNVKLSAQYGRTSGFDTDKIHEFGLKLSPSQLIKTPVITEAYACFECKAVDIKSFGDHDLFIGEVIALHKDVNGFNEQELLDTRNISPLLYLGSDFYITIDPDSLKHVLPDD